MIEKKPTHNSSLPDPSGIASFAHYIFIAKKASEMDEKSDASQYVTCLMGRVFDWDCFFGVFLRTDVFIPRKIF